MLLASVVLILSVALTPLSNAATTYNLALLQETLEVIGEDVVMFITNKLNGGENDADDDDSLYETADEQPEDIDDDEDDEEVMNPPSTGESGVAEPKTELAGEKDAEVNKSAEERKDLDNDNVLDKDNGDENNHEEGALDNIKRDEIKASTQPLPSSKGKKRFVTDIKESKGSSKATKEDNDGQMAKQLENAPVDDVDLEETAKAKEEEEPDMAEQLASVAINVAAQKLKEQLAKLNIQLK